MTDLDHTQNAQSKIWEHFQGDGVGSFAGAKPRLDYLNGQIAKLSDGRSVSVLDVGSGDGYFEVSEKAQGRDSSSVNLEEAAVARLVRHGIEANVGLFSSLPLQTRSVDFVVASEVLEHLTDSERVASVAETFRVLKAGGWFVGTVPFNEDIKAFLTICPSCGNKFHRWGQ